MGLDDFFQFIGLFFTDDRKIADQRRGLPLVFGQMQFDQFTGVVDRLRHKRGLSFAELSHVEAGHLERLLAGEIQWAMQKLFRQYDGIADLLLPTEFVPKEKATPAKEKAKAEPQPQLNFEE